MNEQYDIVMTRKVSSLTHKILVDLKPSSVLLAIWMAMRVSYKPIVSLDINYIPIIAVL